MIIFRPDLQVHPRGGDAQRPRQCARARPGQRQALQHDGGRHGARLAVRRAAARPRGAIS